MFHFDPVYAFDILSYELLLHKINNYGSSPAHLNRFLS
jgi:hypothetical protein